MYEKPDVYFDLELAIECAKSFSTSTEIASMVSLYSGEVLYETGYGCASCEICENTNMAKDNCIKSHIYGMTESHRLGGKYIYFCPMGLTCFVSPIVGDKGPNAQITVGPFLMVDKEDYIDIELNDLMKIQEPELTRIKENLENIPFIPPKRVNDLSTLLFMAVGFMNNIGETNRMMDRQQSNELQKKVSDYIYQLKDQGSSLLYPFDIEKRLLKCISDSDRAGVQKYLNDIFGYIFFSIGHDFPMAKSRIYELLVLISRTAIGNGADPEKILLITHNYLQTIAGIDTIEELCSWLTKAANQFMDSLFSYFETKHTNVINKSLQYINTHYSEDISLENVAQIVYLSPAYFSRIFKQETGSTFSSYLNEVRIKNSKYLLKSSNTRLVEITWLVGFKDQAYFSKVFKRITGISPLKYRKEKQIDY